MRRRWLVLSWLIVACTASGDTVREEARPNHDPAVNRHLVQGLELADSVVETHEVPSTEEGGKAKESGKTDGDA